MEQIVISVSEKTEIFQGPSTFSSDDAWCCRRYFDGLSAPLRWPKRYDKTRATISWRTFDENAENDGYASYCVQFDIRFVIYRVCPYCV